MVLFGVRGVSRRVTDYNWRLPLPAPPGPVPADNPMSTAKVELGRRLFYDADLSLDGTIACATCHEQHRAFTEGNPTHPGVQGALGRRNVMALANVGYFTPLTWANPKLDSLERQILVPMFGGHPVEMGMTGKEQVMVDRLAGDACYRRMFAAAFPDQKGEITITSIAKAVSAFERTLLSFGSPYDAYRRGDGNAIAEPAKHGAALFTGDKLRCASCHAGPNFTDEKFHKIEPVSQFGGIDNRPRVATGVSARRRMKEVDAGRFRTPSLRNVALTGPYMHDGTTETLAGAIRRHADPETRDAISALSDGDLADLIAFLGTLTDHGFVSDPTLRPCRRPPAARNFSGG